MTDVVLRDALTALKTKIQALSSSDTATAEDLAMLGNAMANIAGKVSVVEIEILAEEFKAGIETASTNGQAALATDLAAALATFTALVTTSTTSFTANATTKEVAYNDNATAKTTTFDTNSATKLSTFNTNAADKTTAFNTNASDFSATLIGTLTGRFADALLTSSLSAADVTRDKHGRVTALKDGLVRYTNIIYSRSGQVKSWTEATEDQTGATVAYNFVAVYNKRNGDILSISRTAV